MNSYISDKLKHFFHVVSNVRPIIWIGVYVALMPIFAVVYQLLPDGQFRIPDGAGTDFGSWLYYSIVTITTLGFGDYTPAHGWAQGVTAVEVMCGLIILGFFLNAVGSMKSEIDVESEIEKQRLMKEAENKQSLIRNRPAILHTLHSYLSRVENIKFPLTGNSETDVESVMKCAARTALHLDSLQTKVDLTQWPTLLEQCFMFVADYQLFATTDNTTPSVKEEYIKNSMKLAQDIETQLLDIK